MDDGLESAEFLDELIPVEGWATDGQPNARSQPQTDEDLGLDASNDAGNRDQRQRAASADASS
jgi:hypothetical protein